jgi:hypothetical protein
MKRIYWPLTEHQTLHVRLLGFGINFVLRYYGHEVECFVSATKLQAAQRAPMQLQVMLEYMQLQMRDKLIREGI